MDFYRFPFRHTTPEIAGHLDWAHPDPFDRMLVAQARTDGMILVHADSIVYDYKEVAQLWAR